MERGRRRPGLKEKQGPCLVNSEQATPEKWTVFASRWRLDVKGEFQTFQFFDRVSRTVLAHEQQGNRSLEGNMEEVALELSIFFSAGSACKEALGL